MRALLVILGAATVVLLGCGEQPGRASCAAAVRWNQTLYYGQAMRAPLDGALGQGVVPACSSDDADEQVTVRRVANVPPALAVARDGLPRGASVYLAPGFFPILADHPLHRALVRRAGGLPQPHGCSRRFRLTGTVLRTPITDGVSIASDRRRLSFNVVTTTKIRGFRRAGYAYLQRRDLVEVRGRRCNLPDSAGAYVADLVAPAD